MPVKTNQDISSQNLLWPDLRLWVYSTPKTYREVTKEVLEHLRHYSLGCGDSTEASKISIALEAYNQAGEDIVTLNDAQDVLVQVAKELAGLTTPCITRNPVIKAVQPIELKDGYFVLTHHHIIFALGRDVHSTKDSNMVRRQTKKNCSTLFLPDDKRTTITYALPDSKDKLREKTYIYTVNLEKVLTLAHRLQSKDVSQTNDSQVTETEIGSGEGSSDE